MKLSEFRKIIKEEVAKTIKEAQTSQVDIWASGTINNLKKMLTKLGDTGTALSNIQPKSNNTYTAQLDLDKFIGGLNTDKRTSLGQYGKGQIGVYYGGVIAFILENLDTNTFNTLKKLITKPAGQTNNSPEAFVDTIVDLASSGAGNATGLQGAEFANVIRDIKKSNQMSAVDKALTKYINSSEEGAFTLDDYENLQAAGFKMQGVNYDNLS
jgi:hypothetical protein